MIPTQLSGLVINMVKLWFSKFLTGLTEEQRSSIKVVTGDGAKWIDECIAEYLPECARCVDSFHVVEWAGDALDSLKEAWRNAYQECRELKQQIKRKRGRGALADKDSIAVHNAEIKASEIKGSTYTLGKAPEHLTNKQEIQLAAIAAGNKRLYKRISSLRNSFVSSFTWMMNEMQKKHWITSFGKRHIAGSKRLTILVIRSAGMKNISSIR